MGFSISVDVGESTIADIVQDISEFKNRHAFLGLSHPELPVFSVLSSLRYGSIPPIYSFVLRSRILVEKGAVSSSSLSEHVNIDSPWEGTYILCPINSSKPLPVFLTQGETEDYDDVALTHHAFRNPVDILSTEQFRSTLAYFALATQEVVNCLYGPSGVSDSGMAWRFNPVLENIY